jgi:hypothetical protein
VTHGAGPWAWLYMREYPCNGVTTSQRRRIGVRGMLHAILHVHYTCQLAIRFLTRERSKEGEGGNVEHVFAVRILVRTFDEPICGGGARSVYGLSEPRKGFVFVRYLSDKRCQLFYEVIELLMFESDVQ